MTCPANRRAFGHIYKRGPVWYARYTVSGKRREESTRSPRRSDALKLLARRQGEVETGTFAVATTPDPRRSALYVIRKDAGLTQAELASRAGVNVATFAQWETGHHWPHGLRHMVRLADVLATTIDALLERETPTPSMPDATAHKNRELLAAMKAHAEALYGPEMLQRVGGWRRVAETAFLGYLIGRRDQDLLRPDNSAPYVEEAAAKHRLAVHRAAQRGQPAPRYVPPAPPPPPPGFEPGLKPIHGRIWPKDWYESWESPRQVARRLSLPELAPRRITAKQAAQKRKLLTQGGPR